MTTLWMKAASFAAHKHRNQVRKDGKTPYIAHPFRVAMIVRDLFGVNDEEVLAAALLHDTIEDTDTDYDDIADAFGERVADLVGALTKDMRLPDHKRETAYDRQLAEGPWEARLIKLADVLDNITDASHEKMIRKASSKVVRAIKLAENDEELSGAVQVVKEFAEALMVVEV
ncbi:MAG TPA: HD domain-containing protein [Kiritimatiellia bacterium]|nr:HD domain-containing protein [Kiritimatiellia bacterium]